MKFLLSKICTVIIFFLKPTLSGRKRYYLRYYYWGRMRLISTFFADYVWKRKYRNIKYKGEFAPELKFIIPFAYWHYKNNTLQSTKSVDDTSCFYFFSINHEETKQRRIWSNYVYDLSIPNSHDHSIKYDYSKWEQVPFKEFYEPQKICFDLPTLVISNKFNSEWGGAPVNYLSIDVLESLFLILKDKYRIIYNRPSSENIVEDNSSFFELGDRKLLDACPWVYDINTLFEKCTETSFNRFQLRIYAGCSSFISVQGGNSVLASYFGGDNIIFAKKGLEIEMGEYLSIYPKLSDAKIHPIENYELLINKVNTLYL